MDAPTDADLIAFAARFYRHAGSREKAIDDELGMTAVRYWQQVNSIIDNQDRVLALPFELGTAVKRLLDQRLVATASDLARRAS